MRNNRTVWCVYHSVRKMWNEVALYVSNGDYGGVAVG
jgi:hypothetical protein